MPPKRARTKHSIAEAAAAEKQPTSPSKEVDKHSTSPSKPKKVKTEPSIITLNLPCSNISKEIRMALRSKATSQFVMIDDQDVIASSRRIADRILNGHLRKEEDYKARFPAEVKIWNQSKINGKDLPRAVVGEYKRILSQHLCRINKNWYQYQHDSPSGHEISTLNLTLDNFWDDFIDLTRPESFSTMAEITALDSKGNMLPKKDAQQRFSDSYDVSF